MTSLLQLRAQGSSVSVDPMEVAAIAAAVSVMGQVPYTTITLKSGATVIVSDDPTSVAQRVNAARQTP